MSGYVDPREYREHQEHHEPSERFTGRHRRGSNTQTWTPAPSFNPHHHRHRRDLTSGNNVDVEQQSISGQLPMARPPSQLEHSNSPVVSDSAAVNPPAIAPVTTPAITPVPARRTETSLEVRRTKVTMRPLEPDVPDKDATPVASPTGLDAFDLGTVPASVTPPRSWRKAAWFATASSSAVVIALLIAASFLVGKPAQNLAGVSWPGLQGIRTDIPENPTASPPEETTDADRQTSPDSETSPSSPQDDRSQQSSPPGTSDVPSPTSPGTSGSVPGPLISAMKAPAKPAPTPAPYTADDPKYLQPAPTPPATLASKSQGFLDKVTEDPAAAHNFTTGKLQQEGQQALANKYADVAYYEVKHIEVRQYEGDGVTVCTVETVRKDGSSTVEKHTLTFADDAKIQDDGK